MSRVRPGATSLWRGRSGAASGVVRAFYDVEDVSIRVGEGGPDGGAGTLAPVGDAWVRTGRRLVRGERAAYGLAFPDVGERFDRFEEQLEVLTGLWATPVGQTYDHAGKRENGFAGKPARSSIGSAPQLSGS